MTRPILDDLQRLFELSVDVLCVVSSDGRILACNPAWEHSLGYDIGWIENHTLFDTTHPDDLESVIAATKRVADGMTTVLFENRCLTASGEVRWFQWNARLDSTTGRIYASGRDITNLHVSQERLQRYADLLERTQVELKEAIEELTAVSNTDQLTGLLNRRAFEQRAAEEISRSQRAGSSIAIAIFDIDQFKVVNDTYGHPTGDVVLREVARRLDAARRHQDIVGRWGGEEFIALFPEATVADARLAAERLMLSVSARPVTVGSLQLPVHLSGGATADRVGVSTSLFDLVAAADIALLRAKENGRDRIETQPPKREAPRSPSAPGDASM